MGWNTVIEKHLERFDRDFIELTDDEELNFLTDAITDSFLHLRRDKVRLAIRYAAKELIDPCPIDTFVTYISARLSQVQ